LRETDRGDYRGTTSAASSRAAEQIKAVLGEEKAGRLVDFVREKWGGDPAGALPTTPNSVPTDTRVVVNAPAYRMDVYENGQLVKTYKVGIGYPEFPLPAGLRLANTIIFNPTWTPPDEPWVEAPNSKVKVGEKVEAGSELNPLGLVKIPIGLPSLIHGGKAAAKLGGFASHGCVGLTNSQVQDFAQHLARLGGAELSPAQVAQYARNRTQTKMVKLDQPMPVELRYETIVVEDGKLHIYRDVYDRNTNTEEELRRVLEAHGVRPEQLSPAERAQVTDALQQMSRDAAAKPGQPGTGAEDHSARAEQKKRNAANGKVTRSVRGEKEIVIEVAALAGKGYPAPVALDGGGAKTSATTEARKGRRR
jgi:lipoprotein-anchoring transpeptidase ErfK/SrfK